jgi:hypothetical protein
VSFYVSTATFFLLHCDEWDPVVALPRHKFVTGATLLQLVTPVYKNKGCTSEVSNYRPISLTCVLCKIMENIIVKHMFNYVREHNILTEHQSGFQPIDSTVNQLLHIYHTIISNLDVGKDV